MATFTLNIQANQLPVVTANSDANLNAGATLNLTGTATDPDGTIISTLWQVVNSQGNVVALPSGASFGDASSLITTVTGLTFGNYIFRLTATDSAGQSASATTNTTVANSPITLSRSFPSTIDENTTTVTLDMTANDADGVMLLEILNPGDPSSTASYPPGASPVISPMSATINQPYPMSVDLDAVVTNMIPTGIYRFSVRYRGVGDNSNFITTLQVVKNNSVQNSTAITPVPDCAANSSSGPVTPISYFGQDIVDGTVLYTGNIGQQNPFVGDGTTLYRGTLTSYVPGNNFNTVTITSFIFTVSNQGVVGNINNCT